MILKYLYQENIIKIVEIIHMDNHQKICHNLIMI